MERADGSLWEATENATVAIEELRENCQVSPTPERYPCYVVELDGRIQFHYDWDTCKFQVQGSPATFKKVRNAEELAAFLGQATREAAPEAAAESEGIICNTPPWE